MSLFYIFNKAIESAIFTFIGFLTEKHFLIPENSFFVLKGTSIFDDLLSLHKKVYQVWKDKKYYQALVLM